MGAQEALFSALGDGPPTSRPAQTPLPSVAEDDETTFASVAALSDVSDDNIPKQINLKTMPSQEEQKNSNDFYSKTQSHNNFRDLVTDIEDLMKKQQDLNASDLNPFYHTIDNTVNSLRQQTIASLTHQNDSINLSSSHCKLYTKAASASGEGDRSFQDKLKSLSTKSSIGSGSKRKTLRKKNHLYLQAVIAF